MDGDLPPVPPCPLLVSTPTRHSHISLIHNGYEPQGGLCCSDTLNRELTGAMQAQFLREYKLVVVGGGGTSVFTCAYFIC